MSATEQLARFIVETKSEEIPAAAAKEARRAIIDCLGVTMAGSIEPAANIMADYLNEIGAKPVASVIGRGMRSSAAEAALANGLMAHALDYDDVNMAMSGHPSVPLLPAAVAVGEMLGATGREVLDAYILGFEIQAKIGRGVNPEQYRLGWHATSTLGTFGAAAAASRLLGLDVDQTRMAIGIAASEAAGLRQNFGTMTKPFHPGNAARGGIVAAALAKRGFTADASIIEAPLGFCQIFAGTGQYDVERITKGLGEDWELVKSGVGIKQYPCCAFTHPAIDAIMDLVNIHDLKPDGVASIEALVNPMAPLVLIHNQPHTGLEGKFSMQFCLSIALLERKVGLAQFTDSVVNQPAVRDLIGKVKMTGDSSLPAGETPPTVVKVTLSDGQTVSKRVNQAKGLPQDPLSDEAIEAKYLDCAAVTLDHKQAKESLSMLRNLEALPEIRGLMQILITPPTAAVNGK